MSKTYDCIKTCRINGKTVEKGETGLELQDNLATQLVAMGRLVEHDENAKPKGQKLVKGDKAEK